MSDLNLDGQLSIWDIKIPEENKKVLKKEENIQKREPIVQKQLEKVQVLENKKSNENELEKLLVEYPGAERIVKTVEGRIWIKLEDETLHLTCAGEVDFKTIKFSPIPYTDEILYSKNDEKINDLQREVLSKFVLENKIEKIVKRYGDKNIIVVTQTEVLGINHQGWVLDFKGQAKYKDDEVVSDREIKIGDLVAVEHKGKKYIGQACRIYGPNKCIINVIFDNKHTAFFRENIKLVY